MIGEEGAFTVGGVQLGRVFAPGGGGGGGGGGTCIATFEASVTGGVAGVAAGAAVTGAGGVGTGAAGVGVGVGAGAGTTGAGVGAATALDSGLGSSRFFATSAFGVSFGLGSGFGSGFGVVFFAEPEDSVPFAVLFGFVLDFFAAGLGEDFVAGLVVGFDFGFSGSGGGAGSSFFPRPITPFTLLKNPDFFPASSAARNMVPTWVSITSVRTTAYGRKIIPMSARALQEHSCIPKLLCIQVLSQASASR